MRMHNTRMGVFAAIAIVWLSGCSETSQQDLAVPRCESTFDLLEVPESLGSSDRFNAALEDFSNREGSYRLGDITAAAGWIEDWDRVVEVRTNITDGKLNHKAETESCWRNLPESDGEGYRPQEYYLFIKNKEPVQVVPWPDVVGELKFGDHGALTRDSLLSSDGNGWIVAHP
ncbi:Uncharacterised protein [Nocardia otitidiscaviarum]|uniref:Lipoprotein n=2 Tax=Nocardia otitidiscaviarum TaxID=1823 RepID=A0A378YHB3_9NOCA|nr:Uncharacterised protein [Nocardia otitidiscaviarum]